MKENFIEIPGIEEEFPTETGDLKSHPMNDNATFRERILTLGKKKLEIDAREEAGEINSAEANRLREELTKDYR